MEVCGETHGFSKSDHGGAGVTVDIWYMGDFEGRSSAGSVGNAVDDDLHREITGNRRTVGSVAAAI